MAARKLTTQTPGEPIQEAETTDQTSPEAEQPAAQVDEAQAADPAPVESVAAPVVERDLGDLPDATEIDPKKITRPSLSKQGYVIPSVESSDVRR